MFGLGILPLLLLAGGVYFVTRKGDSAAAVKPGVPPVVAPPPAEPLTSVTLAKRFNTHLQAFKAADPTFKDEKAANDSFFGGDDRPRALAMAEFAATASIKNPMMIYTDAARKAAADLAIDYRDQFQLMHGTGDLADKLLAEVKAFGEKVSVDEKVWADQAALTGIDKASVALVVDSPLVAQTPEIVVAGPDAAYGANLVDTKTATVVGSSSVNISSDYRLRSMVTTLEDGKMVGAYIGRVIDASLPEAKGRYVVIFAPLAM